LQTACYVCVFALGGFAAQDMTDRATRVLSSANASRRPVGA
jgi:hypothetical protein